MRIKNRKETIDAEDVDASGSRFRNVSLATAVFDDVDMTRVSITRANLAGTVIGDADLRGVVIHDSKS